MAASNDPLEVYRREVTGISALTKEEATLLFQRARKSDEQGEFAKRRLIESHLGLVLRIAELQEPCDLSTLELVQEGNIGLMRALEKYSGMDLDEFSAYAKSYIQNFISAVLELRARGELN